MTIATGKSDPQVRTDVLAELKSDPGVAGSEIGVNVNNGKVTLTGDIVSYPKKLAVIEAAERVYGVLDVVDKMKIKLPAPCHRSDSDLATAVRRALQWDVRVPDERITSTVSNGEVTLRGKVATWVQLVDAELAVRRLIGVKNVINQIAVAGPAPNPVLIRQMIEGAIERQTVRELQSISVAVSDDTVTLTGRVRSWAERRAIEGAAGHAPGVQRVENKTVVDPQC